MDPYHIPVQFNCLTPKQMRLTVTDDGELP